MVNKNKKEATSKFYKKLDKLSQDAKEHPEDFIPLEEFLKCCPISQQT